MIVPSKMFITKTLFSFYHILSEKSNYSLIFLKLFHGFSLTFTVLPQK